MRRVAFTAALATIALVLSGGLRPPSAAAGEAAAATVSPPLVMSGATARAGASHRIPASFSLPLPSFPSFPIGPGLPGGGSLAPSVRSLIGGAINEWFTSLVRDAINPAMVLVGRTLLATPQITDDASVKSYWGLTLGIADTLLVLLIVAGGALVMFHETLQSRYAIKDLLPRIALGAILANTSLVICGQMVSVSNALASALIGNGVNPEQAGQTLEKLTFNSIESGGIFLVLLGLVAGGVVVALLVVHAVVYALKVLGVVASALCLLAHGHPATEGLAHLWWRCMAAVLGVQVAQALVLSGAVRVFFTSGGQGLGFGSSGGLSALVLVLCLLFILFRIPFWAKELALSGRHRSDTARLTKTYIAYRVVRGVIGGGL
jgi:hypothetical protein